MVSHGTGPQFGTLMSLVMLQSQPWAGPAGSCCAHPTRALQTGRRFLPRLLLTHTKAHAWGRDCLPLLPRGCHSHAATSPSSDKGLQLQSLTTHTLTNYSSNCCYTEQEHELSRHGTSVLQSSSVHLQTPWG